MEAMPMRKPKAKKPAARAKAKPAKVDPLTEKRANAYADMEPHLCDVVRMGEIAMMLFDSPDQGLFVFAVGHLEEMLQDLRKRYYAEEFPI
jgi:hypothetical protein